MYKVSTQTVPSCFYDSYYSEAVTDICAVIILK
jgi:hypothetical protein